MKKRNNAKAALTGLIIILAVMLSVMLVCTGCGKKSGSTAEEGTTQSLPTETIQTEQTETTTVEQTETQAAKTAYKFRNYDLLKSHYKKHGKYMGFDSPEEYLAAANAVILVRGSGIHNLALHLSAVRALHRLSSFASLSK